jgi:hypothetical protein
MPDVLPDPTVDPLGVGDNRSFRRPGRAGQNELVERSSPNRCFPPVT